MGLPFAVYPLGVAERCLSWSSLRFGVATFGTGSNRSYPGTPPFRCSRAPSMRSRGWKPLFIHFFLHLHLCHRYRLWVFNILKLSCTLEEDEEEMFWPISRPDPTRNPTQITDLHVPTVVVAFARALSLICHPVGTIISVLARCWAVEVEANPLLSHIVSRRQTTCCRCRLVHTQWSSLGRERPAWRLT